MAKRKIRTKSHRNPISLYKKNILMAIGISISVIIIYYLMTSFKSEPLQKEKKIVTLDSVKIDSIQNPIRAKKVRMTQIEILNGCGINNITGLFKAFFKKNNIDIIGVGNYADFKQQKSFIIYHSYDVEKQALEIANKLNIDTKLIQKDIFQTPTHELTLVLGFDYAKLKR